MMETTPRPQIRIVPSNMASASRIPSSSRIMGTPRVTTTPREYFSIPRPLNLRNEEGSIVRTIQPNVKPLGSDEVVLFALHPHSIIKPLRRRVYKKLNELLEMLIATLQMKGIQRNVVISKLNQSKWLKKLFDYDGIGSLINVFKTYLCHCDVLVIPLSFKDVYESYSNDMLKAYSNELLRNNINIELDNRKAFIMGGIDFTEETVLSTYRQPHEYTSVHKKDEKNTNIFKKNLLLDNYLNIPPSIASLANLSIRRNIIPNDYTHIQSISNPPPEVTTTVPLGVEPSSNYLPVNGRATPGDRGEDSETIHGSRGEVNREAITAVGRHGGVNNSTGPQVEPAADLREAKGQLNREAATASGKISGGEADGRNVTSSGLESRQEIDEDDIEMNSMSGYAASDCGSSVDDMGSIRRLIKTDFQKLIENANMNYNIDNKKNMVLIRI